MWDTLVGHGAQQCGRIRDRAETIAAAPFDIWIALYSIPIEGDAPVAGVLEKVHRVLPLHIPPPE